MTCLATALLLVPTARAQTVGSSVKANRNIPGSPLDTLRATHLWTDIPPARAFVRESRPDPKQLDFAPLSGSEPARAKPRDKANVAALQAELEGDGAVLSRKGEHRRATVPKSSRVRSSEVRSSAGVSNTGE